MDRKFYLLALVILKQYRPQFESDDFIDMIIESRHYHLLKFASLVYKFSEKNIQFALKNSCDFQWNVILKHIPEFEAYKNLGRTLAL